MMGAGLQMMNAAFLMKDTESPMTGTIAAIADSVALIMCSVARRMGACDLTKDMYRLTTAAVSAMTSTAALLMDPVRVQTGPNAR